MTPFRVLFVLGAASLLAGCSTFQRLEDIGSKPKLAPMVDPRVQVSVPMPAPTPEKPSADSLWQPGARSFFHDPRASRVGDILTVNISVADAAKLSNTTSRSRTNSDNANLTNFFGLEKALPSSMDPSKLVGMGSDTSNVGAGTVNRSEQINLTLAALVTQILPNGNMVIAGHQQVRVNGELRDLQVSGIVRTEDITSDNTVDLTQIAEARISYGGEGTVSDVQEPRLGSQLYDILMPW
ncbi:MAG: flagellar basal body L-ring protein FlgH [Alphaproteobacteria bacterium]|nr:flagellar basal body L-ring protein FlgH [Alphaproteobacteria bacterium]MDE1987581.1 flagellar basal body L-ring protein FlgH [Alphaproteobacteria bacterium]MDE2164343.1 flagellar basal body L-ring protein FlgH [Alphaproteobacteria bacterium]MDE2264311.1 flagellar basal body L-ring protein FlgH [Alphaproteobacteria bacterium]MDE2499987.1 flagellar basal body L-ring protein FlgH [Alphaproteobacteria bacterium]